MLFLGRFNVVFALLFGMSCIQRASAQPVTTCPVNQLATGLIPALTEKYEVPEHHIRVFYAHVGEHAIPDKTDLNGNGVPDYVENVERQADAARKAFNLLGFRDPLESGRFRVASHVDINLGDMVGGLAFSEPSSYAAVPQREGICSIRIDLSNKLIFPGTYSIVAHELFHLYQYGYTMFKRPWLIEPTANWAERIIRTGSLNHPDPSQMLPQTMEEMQKNVFEQTYPYNFWSRLAVLMDPAEDTFDLPADLRTARYVDGTPIFKDEKIRGFSFLSTIFQYLDAEDAFVSQLYGWPEYNWGSGNQNNAMHDVRMLKVIQRAVWRTGMKNHQIGEQINDDIDGFLAIN